MATSGSYVYSVTGNNIIAEGLGLIGVYDPGESIPAEESTDALRTLNFMIKAWQGMEIGMWVKKQYALFLQSATESYNIGATGDHSATSFGKSELSADAASAATSVTVDSISGFGDTFDRDGLLASSSPTAGTITLDGALTTNNIGTLSSQRKILIYSDGDDSGNTFGITGKTATGAAVTENITGPNATTVYSTNTYKTISAITISGNAVGSVEIGQVGDHVGIELTSGSMHWTYFAAARSTTISLVTALTGAAATDNHVYSYTTKAERPLEIDEVRLHDNDDNERPLVTVSRSEYMSLSDKNLTSTPNQVYYDPQRTNGVMYVWPIGISTDRKDYIKFTGKYQLQNIDSLTDEFDFPQEWYETIAWNLAIRLAPKYGKRLDPLMVQMAKSMLENAVNFDREHESVILEVG